MSRNQLGFLTLVAVVASWSCVTTVTRTVQVSPAFQAMTVYVPRLADVSRPGDDRCGEGVAEALPEVVAQQLRDLSIGVVRSGTVAFDVEFTLGAEFQYGREKDVAFIVASTGSGTVAVARSWQYTWESCVYFSARAGRELVSQFVSSRPALVLANSLTTRAAPAAVALHEVPRPDEKPPPTPEPEPVQPPRPLPPATPVISPESGRVPSEPDALAKATLVVLKDKCLHCHGGENGQAEKDVYVLDHPRLIATRVLRPGDLRSPLWKVIESGDMPEDDDLSPTERQTVENWISAGAPDWEPGRATVTREFLPEKALLEAIRGDLVELRERDRKWARYFSIAHLYNAAISDGAIESYRIGLSLLLNSLSWRRKVTVPHRLGPGDTLLRIDLRDYNWKDGTWTYILGRYDYPLLWESSFVDDIAQLSGSRVPYVRADWFVARASVPPMYHKILELPSTLDGLESRLQVDVEAHLSRKRDVLRAGVAKSGVSKHNRVVERHVSAYGAYWKSFDFGSSAGRQNIFSDPVNLQADGGEMIFNLPNGMQAYFITDARGRRLDTAPTSIVFERDNPDGPEVINGRSCMRCHYDAVRHLSDQVRPMLDKMTAGHGWIEEARELYPGQEKLDAALAEDRARYRKAVDSAGASVSRSKAREPISRLARRFDSDLDLSLAAAEAGLEPSRLKRVIAMSDKLQTGGLGPLLVDGASIKRDAWQKVFADVVEADAPCEVIVESARRRRETRTSWFRGRSIVSQNEIESEERSVGSCLFARAQRLESIEPEQAKVLYRRIIEKHSAEFCDGEETYPCGDEAKQQLNSIDCRLSGRYAKGTSTQAELQKTFSAALRLANRAALRPLTACGVWLGAAESDAGSTYPPEKALDFLLEFARKKPSVEPSIAGLRMSAGMRTFTLYMRRIDDRWVWTAVGEH